MSYTVHGWVELELDSAAIPVLSLQPYVIWPDEASDYLFGLAKYPGPNPCFANRRVPADLSKPARLELESYKPDLNAPQWGLFGPTWASLSEVEQALARREQALPPDSAWPCLVASVRALVDSPQSHWGWRLRHEDLRFVVWGVW